MTLQAKHITLQPYWNTSPCLSRCHISEGTDNLGNREKHVPRQRTLWFIVGSCTEQSFESPNSMGQYGSRSSVETRVIFQHAVTEDTCPKTDACSMPTSVVHFQKRVTPPASCAYHPPARALEKAVPHSWPPSHRDAGGLVYVMDNPTGGVWVKPKGIWTRT